MIMDNQETVRTNFVASALSMTIPCVLNLNLDISSLTASIPTLTQRPYIIETMHSYTLPM